jgi:formylglycine-generating enzyme required for sulfatase activity
MKHSICRKRVLPLVAALLVMVSAANSCSLPGPDAEAYAAGEEALAAQQWVEAVRHFEALYRQNPDYRDVAEKLNEARYQAGTAHLASGAYDHAIAYLGELDPGYQDSEEKLALALDSSMVLVPAGEFLMGSDNGDVDEGPQRWVYLDAFEIDRHEVTNVQYRRFLLATGRDAPQGWPERYVDRLPERDPDWQGTMYPEGEALYPVVGVNWQDATEYCAWAGKRLPTEAEWEKAARGNDGRTYPWGDAWDPSNANVEAAGLGYTQPVGSYPAGASPYGALDMTGNAWEWVADLYDRQYYHNSPDRNPQGPASGTGERIQRGGAWDSPPDHARASYRNATHCFGPNFRAGFRCARSRWGPPLSEEKSAAYFGCTRAPVQSAGPGCSALLVRAGSP